MNYIKQKREKVDCCNICGNRALLTWDHVPPKIAGNNRGVNANTFFSGFPTDEKYQKQYQSGIKYRTICGQCNNSVLGTYDKAYGNFIKAIAEKLNEENLSTTRFRVSVEINKVCRAICGHFLSAKDFYDEKNLVDIELRKYVLNPHHQIDDQLKLYYWIYPYESIEIIRDVVVANLFHDTCLPQNLISGISSYPIALILDADNDPQCGLDNLLDYTTANIDDIVEIEIDLEKSCYPGTPILRDFLWPFNVNDNWNGTSLVLGNNETLEASRVGRLKSR